MAPRETGLQYDLEEGGDVFFILTNADGAKDFKIMTAPVDDPARANWRELVAHEPGRLILSILSLPRHSWCGWSARTGCRASSCAHRGSGEEHLIAFDEEAYSLGLSGSYEYDTDDDALHLFVDDDAGAGLRLRHGDAASGCCSRPRKCPPATTPTTTSPAG